MLENLVYEAEGKVLEMKRLRDGKIGSTVALKGLFLGEEFSGTWVGEEDPRSDSTIQVEVEGTLTTKRGITIHSTGIGSGIRNANQHLIFRGGVCLSCPPGDFARFNGVIVMWEVEIDEGATFRTRGWECK